MRIPKAGGFAPAFGILMFEEGDRLHLNGAHLLLKVLEELIEGNLDSPFENDVGCGSKLAFYFSLCVIAQIGTFRVFREVHYAGGFDRSRRILWRSDQNDSRGCNHLACLQEYLIRSFQAGNTG